MDISSVLEDQNPHWSDGAKRRASRWTFHRHHVERCVRQMSSVLTERALALIGPRHVGKTIALWQALDRLLDEGVPARRVVYCDLADERWQQPPSPREIAKHIASVSGFERGCFVFFDEIQTYAGWHKWLKSAVDEGQHRYVVTGSAASSLRAGGRESGLGRWDELEIEPLSYAEYRALTSNARSVATAERREMPNAFARYLESGGFPAHADEESTELVRARLREDIAERAILRDLLRLGVDVERAKNLFTYFAQNSGSIHNATNRAADLGVDRKTVAKWFMHLQDTRLVVALPPSTVARQGRGPGKARVALSPHQRVFVCDHSLVAAFAPIPRPLEDPHFRGRAIETLVFRHLREAARESTDPRPTLSYWRVGDDRELDFIVQTRDQRIAIEVSGAAPRAEKIRRVRAAADNDGADRVLFVCDALDDAVEDGVQLVPIEHFVLEPLRYLEERR